MRLRIALLVGLALALGFAPGCRRKAVQAGNPWLALDRQPPEEGAMGVLSGPGKGQQEFLIFKMNDVIITGVTQSDSGEGGLPENVSLVFSKVDLEYKPQKPDGSLDAGVHFKYDIGANKIW